MEDWIEVTLEEYKTLRAESAQAISNQLSILQVGIGAVGLLMAAGLSLENKEINIANAVFLIFVPFVCYLSLIIWLGEIERMMRAGKQISKLEKIISLGFPRRAYVLGWEAWLRTPKDGSKTPQVNLNYAAIIFLFFAIALISIIIGLLKTNEEFKNLYLGFTIASGLVFFIVASHILVLYFKMKKS